MDLAPQPQRIVAALAASVILHGALLGGLQALPRDFRPGGARDAQPLHARLTRPAANDTGTPVPEAQGPREVNAPEDAESPAPPSADAAATAPLVGPTIGPPDTAARPPAETPPAEPSHAARERAGLVAAPRYYPAEELDRRPQIRVHVEPEFPRFTAGETRRVVLQLYLNESGSVDDVRIESSGLLDGPFEAAARDAFAAARFVPGAKDGIAVKSLVRIEVRFGEPFPLESAPAAPAAPAARSGRDPVSAPPGPLKGSKTQPAATR